MDTSNLTTAEKLSLLENLKSEEKDLKIRNQKAYTGLKSDFLKDIFHMAEKQEEEVCRFHRYISEQVESFFDIMVEYAAAKPALKTKSFSIIEGNYKLEKKVSKVKKFDERADIAAERLVQFLSSYIETKEGGENDPIYQLAMLAISKTRGGEFDNKQVANLYKIEEQFNSPEFSEIVSLFKQAHTVDSTVTHYYFWKKDVNEVWQRVELSFNKL